MSPLLYFLLFLKASLFSTGGLANLPSLYQDLIPLGWATQSDFTQAVAIGQVTPGPSGLWVVSLGYLSMGISGSLLALLAICIPPCLILALNALYHRFEHRREVQGLMRGMSLAVAGLLVVVCSQIASAANLDWRGAILAAVVFAVGLTGRVHVFFLLVASGGIGFLVFS